jgi:hypothetical protein
MGLSTPSAWIGEWVTLEMSGYKTLQHVQVIAASDAEAWIEVKHGDSVCRFSCQDIQALIVPSVSSHPP